MPLPMAISLDDHNMFARFSRGSRTTLEHPYQGSLDIWVTKLEGGVISVFISHSVSAPASPDTTN